MTETTGTAAAAQGAQQGEAQGAPSPAQGAQASRQQPTPQGDGQQQTSQQGDDPAALQERIVKLERENYQYRERERQRQQQPAPDADAAERLSKLQSQVTEMQSQRQEQSLQLAAVTAAQKLGFRNPELAYRLLDKDAVQYADDGTATNVEKLLTELAKSDQYLLAGTDFGGGPRGASSAQSGEPTMNDLLRQSVGR